MIKAVILKDLTKYNPKLTKGLVGTLIEKDCETFFLKVKFPDVGTFKIQSAYIGLLDQNKTLEFAKKQVDYYLSLEKATNVICVHGPRGGFKKLSFILNNKEHSFVGKHFKEIGLKHLEMFKTFEIPVKSIVNFI